MGDTLSEENDESNTTSDRSPSPEPTVLQSGPFQGASFPHRSARANAAHFVREHVEAYLITHPHLDHISGFAMNTAAFHNTSRPKKVSALPFTVNAIKQHIFNDVIWPNLTDEEDGVGFVTFQRLTEGGNLALGEGHSRGFIEVCNGLAVKAFKVSHGICASAPKPDRRGSRDNIGAQQSQAAQGQHTPHHAHHAHNRSLTHSHNPGTVSALKLQDASVVEGGRRSSIFSQPSQPGTPTFFTGQDPMNQQSVVDSTAFFIRADHSGREILIFGDVEPDSISLCPRTHIVWSEAAPKIAAGLLAGIFIECSYNDSQSDKILFGHLAPRHLIAELQSLAEIVVERKREHAEKAGKKRKRLSAHSTSRTRSQRDGASVPAFPSDERMRGGPAPEYLPGQTDGLVDFAMRMTPSKEKEKEVDAPLKGVKVVVIHMKDSMMDGPLIGQSILDELHAHEHRLRVQGRPLGCEFAISRSGDSYFF
jgi:elongation factor 1-gamma